MVAPKKYILMLAWGGLLGLIVLSYWPGLYGGFVFDDNVNILQNENLKIREGGWQELWAAAISGHAGPLGRPVALLTFALNYYWAGTFNPFQFKLVNLGIHLANAILIGIFTQQIYQPIAQNQKEDQRQGIIWIGMLVAALWALHPLNLTAVLYVVQRMTSLCTFFGMAGLLIFAWYRNATYSEQKIKHPLLLGFLCALSISSCLLLSALAKESGILFAPLLFWTEWCIFRFRHRGIEIRFSGLRLCTIVAWGLTLVVISIGFFKLPMMVNAAAYANRDFTLLERALTEARIIVFYLRMLVLPANSQLSLYHDDFVLSRSLLSPPSTLLALGFLLLLTIAAWLLRKRFIMLWFGWGWFLISHALESTIFPLELVYEHRNYFAIIGPLLMVPAILRWEKAKPHRRPLTFGVIVYIALLGFVTYSRSLQWSNPMDWAALEAENKPASMRANYELGRNYILLMQSTQDPKFGQLADDALIRSAHVDPGALLPLATRVQLAYMRGTEPAPALISQIKSGFRSQKYRNINTAILTALVHCQLKKTCHLSDNDMLEIMAAALANPLAPRGERAEVLKLAAQYRINDMNDLEGGIDLIKQSIKLQDKMASRIMYAQALAMNGDFDKAMLELNQLETIDTRKEYARMISLERENIQKAMQ